MLAERSEQVARERRAKQVARRRMLAEMAERRAERERQALVLSRLVTRDWDFPWPMRVCSQAIEDYAVVYGW